MSSPIDVQALRAATPGCTNVAHLNNAGAGLMSRATVDAVTAHLALEASIGGYEAADRAAEAISAVRSDVAALIGGDVAEVAITTGDTASFAKAFWGFVIADGLRGGGRILVDRIAYSSHYFAVTQAARRHDVTVEVVPSEPDGTLDVSALHSMLDERVRLVSATHVATHRGLVNPVEEVGAVCRDAGVPYFMDACQSVGQLPVDVGAIGCDVLTATGRKWLRGPRGTGLLWVRRGFLERLEPPGIDGVSGAWTSDGYVLNDDGTRFEEFERAVAAEIGLGVAASEALAIGLDAIAARVNELAERLRALLVDVAGVDVHDGGRQRSGIVTFTVDGVAAADVSAAAAAAKVNLSVSPESAAMLDMPGSGHDAVVRASPHVYNTDDELDRLIAVVRSLRR
jgi:cysteine desulfurase / selenocysteine lyase